MYMRGALCAFLCLGVLPAAQDVTSRPGAYGVQLERALTREAHALLERRVAEVAKLREPAEIRARQERIRRAMLEQIGGLPSSKTPLNARVTGGFARQGYRVEHVIFESLPGFRVTANLYIPTAGSPPYPAVLGVAGHSANGKASATYQRAWIGFVKRGYVVLAFDPPGQGERLEYYDPDTGTSRAGVGTREHIMAGVQCLLTGTTFARYEIWDGIRAFDYLLTRAEVDPVRIAVAGNSGGGTQAAYLAVFEPRLAAAVSSCYITGWKQLWTGPGPQDAEQVFANFIRDGFDFGDFLLAFAPKPFLMTTAIRDFFPIDGARETYREASRLYELLGASERAGYFEYDDTHGWSQPRREAAARWLDKFLQDRETDGKEPPITVEPESLLYATATGQLATSGGSETVQSLNLAYARELEQKRPAVTAERIRSRLGIQLPVAPPPVTSKGSEPRDGYRVELLDLTVMPEVAVPAMLFMPERSGAPKAGIVYVSAAGMSAEAGSGQDLDQLARAGHIVLALDPRGMGAAAGTGVSVGYNAAYRMAARGWLLGRPLVGMQVEDVLAAFHLLRRRDGVDPNRIGVMGKGSGGVLALLAALLEPGIARVAMERSVLSYMDIVAAKIHSGWTNLVAPGILADFDLPQAAALLGSRPLWIVSPVHPNGARMLVSDARARFPAATILERIEGASSAETYREWQD